MKRSLVHILTLTGLMTGLTVAVEARQSATPPPRPRIAAQQPQGGAGKVPKQAQQLPRNLTADQPTAQPNAPKRLDPQQQKNRIHNFVVDKYLGGFQKNVGLDDEQTRKFSGTLGNYVRKQLTLADRKNEAMNRLKELNEQKASEEEIQSLNRIIEETETQQGNVKRRFYAELNPQLSVQQQAKLKVYMDNTEQYVRNAIQKSRSE